MNDGVRNGEFPSSTTLSSFLIKPFFQSPCVCKYASDVMHYSPTYIDLNKNLLAYVFIYQVVDHFIELVICCN